MSTTNKTKLHSPVSILRSHRRRGVTLLMVLALMTMFSMLIVTFMIVTTQSRSRSEISAKALLDPPENMVGTGSSTQYLERAMQALLVGGDHAIGPHSILENLYGDPTGSGLDAEIASNGVSARNDTFLVINAPVSLTAENGDFRNVDLIGHVLTIVRVDRRSSTDPSEEQKSFEGKSTFIYDVDIDNNELILVPFQEVSRKNENISDAVEQRNFLNENNGRCHYIINTPAFFGSGPGATFNSSSIGLADAALSDDALTPGNRNYWKNNSILTNPDYTAPDYRSMFLAWIDPSNTSNIIPSFHRPNLVQNASDNSKINSFDDLRNLVLRPMAYDHPDFSGGNPEFSKTTLDKNSEYLKNTIDAFINATPDVDNDMDGKNDSIWLDVGLPAVTRGGVTYKPLAAFLVRDLDGRINVNVHGNLEEDKKDETAINGENGDINVQGSGYGPAEIRLKDAGILSNVSSLLNERYSDGVPGNASMSGSDLLDRLKYHCGINPYAYNIGTGGYGGLVADLFGYSKMTFDPLGNRTVTPINGTNYTEEFFKSPYMMNPYSDTEGDTRFSEDDLQLILRSPRDTDFAGQEQRLRKLLEGSVDVKKLYGNRDHITTRSSDIPVFSRVFSTQSGVFPGLYGYIVKKICNNDTDKANALYNLLPEEIRRGERVNLNRLTLDIDNWTNYDNNYIGTLKKKSQFAHEIFALLSVLSYDYYQSLAGDSDKQNAMIQRLAQWSVNLVDFIDADGIMTPMVYSLDPTSPVDYNADNGAASQFFDNGTAPSGNNRVVWGFEKPEVALTETFCVHNRKTANAITDDADSCPKCKIPTQMWVQSGTCENEDSHAKCYKQIDSPEASFFVELYRTGNPERKSYANDGLASYDSVVDDSVLNLSKRAGTSGTGDPVWRLAITSRTVTGNEFEKTDDSSGGSGSEESTQYWKTDNSNDFLARTQVKQTADDGTETGDADTFDFQNGFTIDRTIWFVASGGTMPSGDYNNPYYSSTGNNIYLGTGQHLVIGPRETTSFVSEEGNGEELTTYGRAKTGERHAITLSSLNKDATTMIAVDENDNGVNVSAPYGGYADDLKKTKPFDEELFGFGTIPCYKTVLLQRLADPLRDYNATTNPYITVDWNMIDLHVINSEHTKYVDADDKETTFAQNEEPYYDDGSEKTLSEDFAIPLCFTSRQWGYTGVKSDDVSGYPNVWARFLGSENLSHAGLAEGNAKLDDTELQFEADMTLGELNKFQSEQGEVSSGGGNPTPGFVHFPWNDAPLANTYELMLIPTCSAGRFGLEFYDTGEDSVWIGDNSDSLGGSGMRYRYKKPQSINSDSTGLGSGTDDDSTVGPYLNFFHSGTTGSLNLARLFEYVRVPSRFAGTIRGWTNETPQRPIYEMREPGKVNLNTVTEETWKTVIANDKARYENAQYDDIKSARNGKGSFETPFRSAMASNLVPNNYTVGNPGDGTLLRSKTTTTPGENGDPDTTTTNLLLKPNTVDDKGTNPYTTLENVMRLSDVTTNRSNVFAIWVTIGYFEATENPGGKTNIYPDGYILGREKGLDDGTVRRHRAFYIIDRSTPVGFRRGQVLNSHEVIEYKKVLD